MNESSTVFAGIMLFLFIIVSVMCLTLALRLDTVSGWWETQVCGELHAKLEEGRQVCYQRIEGQVK